MSIGPWLAVVAVLLASPDLVARAQSTSTSSSTQSDRGVEGWVIIEFANLPDGGKSMMAGAVEKPDAVLMTLEGSENDRYWTRLSEIGWMREEDPPADLPIEARAFSITDLGREMLPTVFRISSRIVSQYSGQGSSQSEMIQKRNCGDVFQAQPPKFKGSSWELQGLAHYMLGFYLGRGEAVGLSMTDLEGGGDLVAALHRYCAAHLETTMHAALVETVPKAADAAADPEADHYWRQRCGNLFREGTVSKYQRDPREMPFLIQFAMGYYAAKGRNPDATFDKLSESRTMATTLVRHCIANPEQTFLTALRDTAPRTR